jgi:hypothetical protein
LIYKYYNMKLYQRMKLLAPCGIDCGVCELYNCKDDPGLAEELVSTGIPVDKMPCPGCRSKKGHCPALPSQCDTYKCVKSREIDYCFECEEFPCLMLHPAADKASTLPHNLKIYNLCQLMNKGPEAFIDMSNGNKKRYFKGKINVGEGPLF